MAYTRIKSRKPRNPSDHAGNATTPLVLALGLGAALYFWWKARRGKNRDGHDGKGKSSRSLFKFPDVKGSAPTSLPRNKSSNNKKNKARKQVEKQRRSEKRAAAAKEESKTSEEQGSSSAAVINYTYFDSARRDTILPTHKKKTLTASDVMKSDSKPAAS